MVRIVCNILVLYNSVLLLQLPLLPILTLFPPPIPDPHYLSTVIPLIRELYVIKIINRRMMTASVSIKIIAPRTSTAANMNASTRMKTTNSSPDLSSKALPQPPQAVVWVSPGSTPCTKHVVGLKLHRPAGGSVLGKMDAMLSHGSPTARTQGGNAAWWGNNGRGNSREWMRQH